MTGTTVMVCQDEAGTDASSRRAAAWVGKNATTAVDPPRVTDCSSVIRCQSRPRWPHSIKTRFAISDVIADEDMGEATRADMTTWTGCIAGALTETEFAVEAAGLEEIEVRETHRVHEHAAAAIILGRKPLAP
jgi:hypothetical protein